MMLIDTDKRTDLPELMDDFSLSGKQLRATLNEIATINRWLGGNKITLEGVLELLQEVDELDEITIVDLGCGNGDMLRMLSDYAYLNKRHFKLIGIDANADTVEYAKELSDVYPNISYQLLDVFSAEFAQLEYDIALCTLTLHHFSDAELLNILSILRDRANLGIVINDLHRNKLAYRLFQMVSFVFNLSDMPKNDGLVSILRGFKKQELVAFNQKLKIPKYHLRWKWAFRYQWIIFNS